ncbi:MAG: nicotinate (nicotinamide) nucleotide adenylyltransferase [Desulfovibrionaceae bacterium]|nr:nicotinate (nicotinamide) nucleotide adenylyltransferase [Desulfovibrionaceae bacterium]
MAAQATSSGMHGLAVLGGCFNPVHYGHVRLALALHEKLASVLSDITFMPSAHPPHKPEAHMLPFPLRAELVRKAIAPYPWMHCSEMEAERDKPSYTWDTLGLLKKELASGQELFFILGTDDYAQLPTWHNGLRLIERATLLVISRGDCADGTFERLTESMWPGAVTAAPLSSDGRCMTTETSRILFQPVPPVPISSSLVRRRWLDGLPIGDLVPEAVEKELFRQTKTVLKHWTESYSYSI